MLLSFHNKTYCGEKSCYLYGDPICDQLYDLKNDYIGFTKKELYRRHNFEEAILLGRKRQPKNNSISSLASIASTTGSTTLAPAASSHT